MHKFAIKTIEFYDIFMVSTVEYYSALHRARILVSKICLQIKSKLKNWGQLRQLKNIYLSESAIGYLPFISVLFNCIYEIKA